MPTPPDQPIHSGEYVSLRDYIDTRLRAIEQASGLSQNALERRLEAMNEIRDALKDQNATFITRLEYKAAHDRLVSDIQMLRESKAMLEGKASQSGLNMALTIAVIGLVLSFIGIVMRFLGM